MKTLDSFIIERLKLTKDSKLQSYGYVLFIWPLGNNYGELQEIYQNNKNSDQINSVKNPSGITAYVCDIDFFNDNVNQKWVFNDIYDSRMFKIPINEIDEVIEDWKNSKHASRIIEKLKKKYIIINQYADIR